MQTGQLDDVTAATRRGALRVAGRRPRRPADERTAPTGVVRLGTVDAATVPLAAGAVRAFRAAHPPTGVEVATAGADAVHRGLLDGTLDLGLLDLLDGDALPAGLAGTEILRSSPVVCMRADDPLATRAAITVEHLRTRPLITTLPGSAMHRCALRLLSGRSAVATRQADGVEAAKLLVAEGRGLAVLPAFAVERDPLERSGVLVHRRVAGDHAEVLLTLVRRRSVGAHGATGDLHRLLVEHVATVGRGTSEPAPAAAR